MNLMLLSYENPWTDLQIDCNAGQISAGFFSDIYELIEKDMKI